MINFLDQDYSWLQSLTKESLQFLRGIEKEGLRVTSTGHLSQVDHPESLGSALTNPMITTDYSEALLEFITPVKKSTDDLLQCLTELHQFTYMNLPDGELIWPGSMPAIIEKETDIRIAEYGTSNIGKLKHIYRHGLWHRYGRTMQSIAGLHFNFSMPDTFWEVAHKHSGSELSLQDFRSDRYFRLIRNFRRHSWLLMYLFGASPAIDKSFLDDDNCLQKTGDRTKFLPYACSIRMSDVGYTNKAQDNLKVNFDSIDSYISSMRKAIHQTHQPYQALGVKKDGNYLQINSNILQIENEYYSDVRPKRVTESGEKPVCALQRRGVEYVEIRCMDLDPFEPLGVAKDTLHFLEIFLTWCLLGPEDIISTEESVQLRENLKKVVHEGFEPGLKLTEQGKQVSIDSMIQSRLGSLEKLAAIIDKVKQTNHFSNAIASARLKVANPETIASNKMRDRLSDGTDYVDLMLQLAQQHKETFIHAEIPEANLEALHQIAKASLLKQKQIEDSPQKPFDLFMDDYQHQDDKYCS